MFSTNSLFLQLAIVLGLSTLVGYLIKFLKLPLMVAYLLAGVILSLVQYLVVGQQILDLTHSQTLAFLPDFGIAFVLFFVGMELDLGELKSLGRPIVVVGLFQIIASLILGYCLASLFGFSNVESFYLGVSLSFSSTIVIVKLLLEKKDLNSLYGKLSLGITLLEDLVAIILLMLMSVGGTNLFSGWSNSLPIFFLVLKGLILFGLALFLSKTFLVRIFKAAASSSELLFLSALAWCFIFVTIAQFFGFSVVIGAFLAGVTLANSPFHFEIQGKVKPLRDFFVALFFVYLGSKVTFSDLPAVYPLIIAFTLYAILIKPIIFLLGLGAFGFRKHTIFQSALNLSQISEFSLIILVVGMSMGLVSSQSLTAMALTGVISIITSSIMITNSKHLYKKLARVVGFFEHGKFIHESESARANLELEDHVILIGGHRVGSGIIKYLKKEGIPFLVLDFDPKIIAHLSSQKIHALYGDVSDPEILEFIKLESAKLLICTAQDLDDNLILLSEAKRRKVQATLICRAQTIEEAQKLYKSGADYVILPETITGDFVTQLLKDHWPGLGFFKERPEIELNKLSKQSSL